MTFGSAGQVEAVGGGEHLRIPVGRAEQHQDDLAAVDRLPGDRYVIQCDAGAELYWWVVPQQLLDDGRRLLRVRAEVGELIRMAQQRERAVGDQVDGRLVAGDEQQDARR